MEAACSSEMSVNFYETELYHIPEDKNLHTSCCENLRSHRLIILFIAAKKKPSCCGELVV
jgi:hypothetical protein